VIKSFAVVLIGAVLLLAVPARAATEEITTPPPAAGSTRTVTYRDAFILGLIEGVTEFLPVSSIGHVILATHALGLDSSEPLVDARGCPLFISHHGELEPLTLKRAVDTYNVIVQAGPILAVLLLFWPRVASVLRGLSGRDPVGLLLLRNLLIAFLPAAVVGLLCEKWIDEYLFSTGTVLAATVAGAVLILVVESWRKTKYPSAASDRGPDLHELTCRQALLIGLCQCVSLWPGTSRSMMTIVGGYFVGFRPARAAEFSFLLGLCTLTAASGYKAVAHGRELLLGLQIGPLLFGIVVATLAAALTVRWFIGWIGRHGLTIFAWYRFALAAVTGCLWLG
jgi:undecaprenyl-diphosphatase